MACQNGQMTEPEYMEIQKAQLLKDKAMCKYFM
jgi:hypothetical protein